MVCEREDSEDLELESLKNRRVGYRFIAYNYKDGGKDKTKLMTFIDDDGLDENDDDKPANNWKKVADWTDDGTKYSSNTKEKYDDLKNGPPYREYPYDKIKLSRQSAYQFIRGYGGNDEGPTIEFQIRKAPANQLVMFGFQMVSLVNRIKMMMKLL